MKEKEKIKEKVLEEWCKLENLDYEHNKEMLTEEGVLDHKVIDLTIQECQKEFEELEDKLQLKIKAQQEEIEWWKRFDGANNDEIDELRKELNQLNCWKCSQCGFPNEHLKEIHTFQCTKCGYKEWYPERIGDNEELENKLKEKEKEWTEKINKIIDTFNGIEFGRNCHPEGVKKVIIKELKSLLESEKDELVVPSNLMELKESKPTGEISSENSKKIKRE